MKFTTYSRYTGDDLGLSAEDLLQALADFLLRSGFDQQYMHFHEMGEQTLDDLKQAIQEALESGSLFNDENMRELMERLQQMSAEQMEKLLDRLIEKMAEEGYISISEPNPQGERNVKFNPEGGVGENREGRVRFELTDKALDFLGFKTLKDLLASLGKSSFGRHDTREMATGVESHGSTRRYEFGDTLNLDVNATLLAAIQRGGLKIPLDLDYEDLQVRQCEYQSSCATVLMLDCSHSMILYGEDRFTPAKKVALALTHLIRTQYPGDTLHM